MRFPLSGPDRAALWLRLGIRGVLLAVCLVLLATLGPPVCSLFAPFLLALLLAWALHPPVRWLQKKLGVSRKVLTMTVVILCFAAVGAALYGLCYMVYTQVRSLVENWTAVRQSVLDAFASLSVYLSDLADKLPDSVATNTDDLLVELLNWLQSAIPSALDASLGGAGSAVARVPAFVVAAIVFMMASYFITADYPRLRFLVTDRLPPSVREFGSNFRRIFREAFGGYLKSQLILSLVVFFILAVGFSVIRQPYGLLLALIFAVLDFIPIIGAGTIMVPWAAVDVVLGNYRSAIELMVIWGVIVLFRRLGEPKILGDQTGLSPILSLIGIYVGMRLAGVLGMIVGPLLLLVLINLWKLGTFDPIWNDIKLCAGDLNALLDSGRKHD